MNEIEKAIRYFGHEIEKYENNKDRFPYTSSSYKEKITIYIIAIQALKEKQEREENE